MLLNLKILQTKGSQTKSIPKMEMRQIPTKTKTNSILKLQNKIKQLKSHKSILSHLLLELFNQTLFRVSSLSKFL